MYCFRDFIFSIENIYRTDHLGLIFTIQMGFHMIYVIRVFPFVEILSPSPREKGGGQSSTRSSVRPGDHDSPNLPFEIIT